MVAVNLIIILSLCQFQKINVLYKIQKNHGIQRNLFTLYSCVRIPLERNSLHALAGRLSAPNGKF